MTNFNLHNLIRFCEKLPENLAKKSFLTFFILSILSFFIGGIVFYKYGYSTEKNNSAIIEKDLQINTVAYQKMINSWEERAEIFEEADIKEFKNPF